MVASELYDGDAVSVTDADSDGVPDKPSSSLLRGRATSEYDEQGRVFRSHLWAVDPSTGAVSTDSLSTDVWYGRRGQVAKVAGPGGLVQKYAHDGAGRLTASYVGDGGGDAGWADAFTVTGDTVLEQAEYDYDANGNPIQVTARQRFHDETATGALGDPATGPKARVYYQGFWYDAIDRLTDAVDVGTNGGSAWARPAAPPSRSDTALVTSWDFNSAGLAETVTDPAGRQHRSEFDDLGRVVRSIEHYTDGTVTDTSNKTVEFTYGAAGLATVTARLTGGGQQTTRYVYGASTATGSGLNSNDVVSAVQHPDPSTGASSSSEQETFTVSTLGQTVTAQDRNGSVHTYAFDVVGRLVSDAVTTLGAGVDGSVRRIELGYDGQGNVSRVTSFDAVTAGNVVNEVVREFNGLGQLTREYQEHAGAVNTGTSRYVGYAYSEMAGGANHSRLTSMTYPSGYALNYDYGTGLNDGISRLASLSDATGTLEGYDYLGLATVVRRSHPQPDVDLTYVKLSGEPNGDAGDPYTGLDRFGRVVDQRTIDAGTGTALDRFAYGYDRLGNRTYRDNLVNPAFGEVYTYDELNQLTSFQRGTLNATKDGISGTPSRTQSWDHDALGNFDGVTTDGTPQARTHTKQNEITAVGPNSLAYDANGNLTTDEQGRQLVYDAWDRLVEVKDSGGATLVRHAYDGLSRRVSETHGTETRELYYSAGWQVLEEYAGGQAQVRYVWSPVYVDAMVLRQRDTDGNGTFDERLWPVQDANYNLTALVDDAGVVVERYAYDAFGARTVYDANGDPRAGSLYAFAQGFQGLRHEPATGHVDVRFRWLSVTLGRPLQRDPIGFATGDLNVYRWEGNGPVGRLDPLGLDPIGGHASQHNSYWSNPGQPLVLQGYGGGGGMPGQAPATFIWSRPIPAKSGSKPIEKPSLGASLVPVIGPARLSGYHFRQGEYGWGVFYGAMAATDVALVKWFVSAAGKLFVKGGATIASREPLEHIPTVLPEDIVWKTRPGIRYAKVGDVYIKEVNPNASRLGRWWGRGCLDAQAKGLSRLDDLAPRFLYQNRRLIIEDVGRYERGFFLSSWLKGSWRLGTPFNDIRPANMGRGGLIFDPALHPAQEIFYPPLFEAGSDGVRVITQALEEAQIVELQLPNGGSVQYAVVGHLQNGPLHVVPVITNPAPISGH